MIRNALAVLALLLLGGLAFLAVVGTHDLASIYGDPSGSELAFFGAFGSLIGIVLLVMALVAAGAVSLGRGALRRVVLVLSAGLILLTVPGVLLASHYGHADKRRTTASPPACGIGNATLDREFRRVDHPGFFGGGDASRAGCAYLLDTADVGRAFAAYDERLTRLGYEVRRSPDRLDATNRTYTFEIEVSRPAVGEAHLTVALHER